ncbi:MAG: hypothetical protein M0008_02895 [Actinomycetota bacterium]|nr:hypothetical protein [Actinomycetota bacterium]
MSEDQLHNTAEGDVGGTEAPPSGPEAVALNGTKEGLDVRGLFPEVDLIADEQLRNAVVAVWEELWVQSAYIRLADVPTSTRIPYPQVKHCQGIVKGALAIAEVWESVHGVVLDRDVLVAGALLMDVSKLVETEPGLDQHPVASAIGRALPHAVYGAHTALNHGVPLSVAHIITAHSPNGGKTPGSAEAHLLDWVDQADISGAGYDIWARRVLHYQP